MQTTYYSLAAKRLTVCAAGDQRRASGSGECVCYAFVPKNRGYILEKRAGKVLDFQAYRQAAQGDPAPEPAYKERPAASARRARRWVQIGRWTDFVVSAALVVAAVGVLVCFFTA
jgi:hypothetical protein